MTIGEDRNKDQFKNWQLCGVWKSLFCDHKAIKLTHNCVCFTDPCINLFVLTPCTREYHPRFSSSKQCRKTWAATQLTKTQQIFVKEFDVTICSKSTSSTREKVMRESRHRLVSLWENWIKAERCFVQSFGKLHLHKNNHNLDRIL